MDSSLLVVIIGIVSFYLGRRYEEQKATMIHIPRLIAYFVDSVMNEMDEHTPGSGQTLQDALKRLRDRPCMHTPRCGS